MQQTQKDKIDRTKNGLLGMALVGALSSDPRLVKIFFININKIIILINF